MKWNHQTIHRTVEAIKIKKNDTKNRFTKITYIVSRWPFSIVISYPAAGPFSQEGGSRDQKSVTERWSTPEPVTWKLPNDTSGPLHGPDMNQCHFEIKQMNSLRWKKNNIKNTSKVTKKKIYNIDVCFWKGFFFVLLLLLNQVNKKKRTVGSRLEDDGGSYWPKSFVTLISHSRSCPNAQFVSCVGIRQFNIQGIVDRLVCVPRNVAGFIHRLYISNRK